VLGRSFVLAGLVALGWAVALEASAQTEVERYELPMQVGVFDQQVHVPYTSDNGLPDNDALQIYVDQSGVIRVTTPKGEAYFTDSRWSPASVAEPGDLHASELPDRRKLFRLAGAAETIRDIATHNGSTAVAAESGLYIHDGKRWELAKPRQGETRWAPLDVRAVTFDAEGQLWFACPQGVGVHRGDGEWTLFTGAEGLPFNDFTCIAAGPKGVWFGTTNGAIRYADGVWEFRQGRRWLLDNHVRDVAIDASGDAWFATASGVSRIAFQPMKLSEKAARFNTDIERYHRRTPFGYVNPAVLQKPGDKSSAVATATDNDGHFMGLYLGAASFGYAATKDPVLRENAKGAFRALVFLSDVTSGGSHPAPKGFIARAIEPTSGPDPNLKLNPETDRKRRANSDALWKIIDPRWPIDETGEWYWKCDSSPDELDGYYFGFGIYYDRVCETQEEKDEVRAIVRSMTDHLIKHGFNMVDHDGKPTRWGHFSPDDMNRNEDWWVERGLNSFSILTYLSVTHHITGDQKYRDIYLKLAHEEGFAMNGMTQPKVQLGPGSFGQADDNMAFMNYYHLIRYETDPILLSMYHNAIYYHWHFEKCELNPFFNFVYAACCLDKVREDHWNRVDLSPPKPWLEESVDTLRRYPLDLIDWSISNAHRIDIVPLPAYTRGPGNGHVGKGWRVTGRTCAVDEQHAIYWGDDPWALSGGGGGTRLREGVPFLLAYYMGLVHGFIAE